MTTETSRVAVRTPLGLITAGLLFWFFGVALLQAAQKNPAPQATPDPRKDYALIFGTVWGPDSRPLAGVPLKIKRTSDKKFKWELTSDRSGEFAQRVPTGSDDYIIQADIKTPKGQPKPEITVHIDENERKDVSLHLTQQDMGKTKTQ